MNRSSGEASVQWGQHRVQCSRFRSNGVMLAHPSALHHSAPQAAQATQLPPWPMVPSPVALWKLVQPAMQPARKGSQAAPLQPARPTAIMDLLPATAACLVSALVCGLCAERQLFAAGLARAQQHKHVYILWRGQGDMHTTITSVLSWFCQYLCCLQQALAIPT